MVTEFTPWQSLAGGAMIGLAAALLMLFLGRVMGVTGILAGFLMPVDTRDWSWRAAVIAGMLAGPAAYLAVTGEMPAVEVPVSMAMLLAGGFAVGLGVTFGSGCTSGHGVCGMARLSPRSIVATLTFMTTAALAVFFIRHVI